MARSFIATWHIFAAAISVHCKCIFPPVSTDVAVSASPLPSTWKYLRVPLNLTSENSYEYVRKHESKLVPVEWTQEREVMCLGLFPGKRPPVSPAIEDSQPVCVLSHDGNGERERAVYYSEYNNKKHIPNLIAYNIPGNRVPNQHTHITRTWGPAHKGLDLAYGPMPVKIMSSGWCENNTLAGDCNVEIGTRGHLATMSAFQPSYQDMYATCVYLNTFPSREPFDGTQWNRYENENIKLAKAAGPKKGLFVVAGPLASSAGTIPAEDANKTLEVPVWVWSAYADLDKCSTVAHICSDGGADDECACQDQLDGNALKKYIGFNAFPGLCDPPAVGLDAVLV